MTADIIATLIWAAVATAVVHDHGNVHNWTGIVFWYTPAVVIGARVLRDYINTRRSKR